MEPKDYIVVKIDGDYAHLKLKDVDTTDTTLVARALLPEGIDEGSILHWEMFQYTLVD